MDFFIGSFYLFFVVCCCRTEQFSVLKPSYLQFLLGVCIQLAFNKRLQEIQKTKKRTCSTPNVQDFESLDFNGNGY